MSNRVLVTGGSGFVAFHIINELLEQDYEVYASIRSNSNVAHLNGLQVTFVQLNFQDAGQIKAVLSEHQIDYIIHAAGTTAAANQDVYNTVNAVYTKNLCEAVDALGEQIQKFVFVSSLASIGPSVGLADINEAQSPAPVTMYGRSKRLAEEYLTAYKNIKWLTFRPTAVYGPRDKDIFIMLKTFINGFEPYIGKSEQQLSFIYVKDLAKLLVDSLKQTLVHQSYNVSDGNDYGRYELAALTSGLINKKLRRFHLPMPLIKVVAKVCDVYGRMSAKTLPLNTDKLAELTASWVCSASLAQKELGFKPQYNLKSGLEESIRWYRDNKWIK